LIRGLTTGINRESDSRADQPATDTPELDADRSQSRAHSRFRL